MSGLASRLLLVALASHACWAGEIPAPFFWPSEADFLRQVSDGEFDAHLELHLLEYSADPGWAADWAAARYAGNGIFGEYGSTTAKNLYVDSRIALNVFPLDRLQIRYERRDYQDGRFDVSDQLLDLLRYPGRSWAVVVSGWPASRKDEASLGLGLRIGAPRSANSLVLRVVDDGFFWNQKTESTLRFDRHPVRVVAEGFLESGRFRIHGSVDYGLDYEATEPASDEAAPGRSDRGYQRFADVFAGLGFEGWALEGRVTAASLERSQDEGMPGAEELKRDYARALLYYRKDLGKWQAYALAGYPVG